MRDLLEKENFSFKGEITKVSKKLFFGSKFLEHILSIEVPYFNKTRLSFEKGSLTKKWFSKFQENIKV